MSQTDPDCCARCGDQFPPGQLCSDCQSDPELLADPGFERRLKLLMRRNPHLLGAWIRKQERIRGARPFGHL